MYVCMVSVASCLLLNITYNATIVVTPFFPYRARTAHREVKDEIVDEVEPISLILLLATSYVLHIKTCHMVCQLVCKISKYSFTNYM